MPWKETSVMEERLRFVARLPEGEGMSDVCRQFGISRKKYKPLRHITDIVERKSSTRLPVCPLDQVVSLQVV